MRHPVASLAQLQKWYASPVRSRSKEKTPLRHPPGQNTATLCYDADFYPYGGERPPIVNTCSQNYKFTGKERDSESGLDNFAARFNSSSLGRFVSPDPEGSGSRQQNPQTWNMYGYAGNNPLYNIDPDGRSYDVCIDNGNGGMNCLHYDYDCPL